MFWRSNECAPDPNLEHTMVSKSIFDGHEYSTGKRKFGSLVGVTVHEFAHTWFQFLLATNEAKHEWMDEGFTEYVSDLCMNEVMDQGKDNPFEGAYRGYIYLANSGKEQPLTTHADRYEYNQAYGIAAYSKGNMNMCQVPMQRL